MTISRRTFVTGATALVTSQLLPAPWWRHVVYAAAPAVPGDGPYGPLQEPDANGLRLPVGFTSRVVATTGSTVGGTQHVWHAAPDGGACFGRPDGGWIYVSNSELGNQQGGVSAISFAADGTIEDAYSILSGTDRNCSGGATPWGTWLSCEEAGANGEVFECDPQQPGQGVLRPALGKFNHEAAAVDPVTGDLYLTEDTTNGRLYRFVPETPGDLGAGELFAASVDGSSVTWIPTSPLGPDRQTTTTPFNGGEGMRMGDGVLYFTTKGDRRVWEYTPSTSTLNVAYDCLAHPEGALDAVDDVNVHPTTQRVFIAEDGGNMELCVLAERDDGEREVAAFCRFVGHGGSEVTGGAFSPDGTRLYLSSQRGTDGSTGVTVEISGPFDVPWPDDPPTVVDVAIDGDAHVRGGTFAANNFAGSWHLQVCYNGSPQYTRWAYLRVDTAAAAGAVTLAVLRLNARMSSGDPSPMEVLAVDPGWDESSITWANRPSPDPTPVGTFSIGTTVSEWFEIDVTGHVIARRAAGATEVAFVVRQVERNGRLAYINSSEHPDDRPSLVLTLGDTPPPPPPVTLDIPNGTYVRGGTFENVDYSGSSLMHVCFNGSDQYTRRSYLWIPTAQLPAAGVDGAILRLTARMSSGDASPMVVRRAAPPSQTPMTWATQPPSAATPSTAFVIESTADATVDIDVGDHVRSALADGDEMLTFVVEQTERNGRLAYLVPPGRSGAPQLTVQPSA